MSDSYWEKEYNYCEERTAQAEAARDQLMHALADCPFREELEKEEKNFPEKLFFGEEKIIFVFSEHPAIPG